MRKLSKKSGFTLVELMVVTLLLGIVGMAGSMLLVQGQSVWGVVDAQSQLQGNMRMAIMKVADELQESGRDSNGNLMVSISNGTGVNGSDILRFAVPLCACGSSPINTSGNVASWGAPNLWGQAGCSTSYTVLPNGKVDICHLPPGNPNNTQNLSVDQNAVKAHLAHGDYIGDCNACSPTAYTNRTVEYLMNASGQLLRRVLDSNNAVVSSMVIAQSLTDFQAALNAGQTAVTVTAQLSRNSIKARAINLAATRNVFLRNY